MVKASDNLFPKIILSPLGAPSAPADASWKVYPMADGIYARSSNSTVGPFGSGSSSVPEPWAIVPDTGIAYVALMTIGAANRALYLPCVIGVACTIIGVKIRVGTQSGNISVGLYSSAGSRVATSGAVACPASGVANVAFTASYVATAGRYYLAISCDNVTATFAAPNPANTAGPGACRFEASAHPLPATATMSNDAPALSVLGRVNGGYP